VRAVIALAAALVVLSVAGAGCTPEDPTQRAVRERVQEHVERLGGYDASKTRCTRTPRPWLVERATTVYLCTARREDGDCDWLRATIEGPDELRVELEARRAGCVLPV
jgi:hypothetical protein